MNALTTKDRWLLKTSKKEKTVNLTIKHINKIAVQNNTIIYKCNTSASEILTDTH